MNLRTYLVTSLVIISFYTAIAYKSITRFSAASETTDKCLVVSKCSRRTYKRLFGYQHDPPRELVTRFQDVMGSIVSFEGQQTALELWSYYIRNVTACGHLAPALPEFHNIAQKSASSKPTLMGTILKGTGLPGFMHQKVKLPIQDALQNSYMPVDPTHPLSKDLKDAINTVVSNHTKAILKKLGVKEETFTFDEINVELSMIDICTSKFPRMRDVNGTKLLISNFAKGGCDTISVFVTMMLVTTFFYFL